MHIVILTVGTLGDVQPYVALGRGLQAAGHRVTVATSARFADLVTQAGIGHRALPVDFLELVQTPEGQRALAGGSKLALLKRIMPLLRQMLDAGWDATADADAVLYHPKALAGEHCAEARGIPGILAHPIPLASPTGAFPSPLMPLPDMGPRLNRLSHRLLLALSMAPYRRMIGRWRAAVLGLPARWEAGIRNGAPIPRLYGYSPHLLPVPADWDDTSYVSGPWVLEQTETWQPPAALDAFLAAGPPPVYVGFGSMARGAGVQTSALVRDALARAELRGVLATGAGGLGDIPPAPHIHLLAAAPHAWLFPRMAAVVHHGGAGTTAAGLRAGRPTLICPFFGDQRFWGRQVAAQGVGPPPIPQRQLTVERLARALTQLTSDPGLSERAAQLGACMRAEDGVGQAVAWLTPRLKQP